MPLIDFIHSKTGFRIGAEDSGTEPVSQLLMTALLVLVAKSDGGISTDESLRMVELLRSRFGINPGEALNLINRASDELSHHAELDGFIEAANDELSLAQKEVLMLMVLNVISADNQKDAGEMRLLAALLEGLEIPDKTMNEVYDRYFDG